MANQLFGNNLKAALSLSTAPGSLSSSATVFTLVSGAGNNWPTPSAGEYMLITLYEVNGLGQEINHEVVKITNRTGDTFSIGTRDFEQAYSGVGRSFPDIPANNPSGIVYAALRYTAYAAGNTLNKDDNLSSVLDKPTARANLGLAIGANVQAYSANLDEYAAVNPTAAGLALLDDADAAAQRTTLGLGTISTQAANNVAITGGAVNGTSVGATTPSTGAFTTLSSTGNATLGDAEDTDTHAIKGATTLLANSASSALTVTQTGSGNAFVVEDSASTDATPFVIDNAGNVGIGTGAVSTRKVIIAHTQSDTANTEIANNVAATATNTSGAATKVASFSSISTGSGYAGTGVLYGNYVQATHAVTGTASNLIANIGIIANTSTGTVSNANNFHAASATNSGGGTISQQIGFLCNDLTAATVNYGFYSSVNSGDNKFGFYAAGTAENYLNGNLQLTKNLTFTGTGNRITGDFSNATLANRVGFKTSTTNGITVGVSLPDGTGVASGWNYFASSDILNSSYLQIFCNSSTGDTRIASNISGTGTYLPMTFYTSGSERLRIDTSGNVLVTNAAGLGYGTGAGGTVTQATSKSTAVTLNKPTGAITMNNAALASNTTVSFVLNNSVIEASDVLVINHNGIGTSANYQIWARCIAGAATINVRNITAGSLSDALVINFAIIKGTTS